MVERQAVNEKGDCADCPWQREMPPGCGGLAFVGRHYLSGNPEMEGNSKYQMFQQEGTEGATRVKWVKKVK